MSDMPLPEPTAKDEELALEFIRIKDETNLQGRPERDQQCGTCHFYDDPGKHVAYCWNDQLEIMVGGAWWCDRWKAIGESEDEESADDEQTARKLQFELVEDQQWLDHPRFGEQCSSCLYYLNPDESVSYCWHPKMQVGVGFDHWCQSWAKTPGQD